ncbi:MAG: type II toxin-antitoxin system RelE/ParE family toxin [Caulobacteraceae bacterium]
MPRRARLRLLRQPAAEDDLLDIWATVALDKPMAADRLIRRFYAAEDLLAEFPEIGEARPDLAPGLRKWTVGSYLMLYRVSDEDVVVVRVLHGARDLSIALGEE